jgi:hypothetical protein
MAKIRTNYVRVKAPAGPGDVGRIENYLKEYAYLRVQKKRKINRK